MAQGDAALPSSQRSTLPQARAAASERLSLGPTDLAFYLVAGALFWSMPTLPGHSPVGWTKVYRGTIVPKH